MIFCYNTNAVEKFKFILFSIVMLSLVTLLGYWALLTIQPGGVHAEIQKQKELEARNEEFVKEIKELKEEIASLQAKKEEKTIPEEVKTEPAKKPSTTTTTVAGEYQNLTNELQKLIDGKVFMKEKSQGSRVGTIQNFLNIYNNTSKKVDNDYGPGTKTDVIKFQTAVGLSADGEAGPSTFTKMIEWLKKQ